MIGDGSHASLFINAERRGQGSMNISDMKKLISLFLVLFLWVGCEKEKFVPEPNISVVPDVPIEPELPYDYAEFGGYHVKDTAGFQKETIVLHSTSSATWIYGIKNQKPWFGLFNVSTKEQTNEWLGTAILPSNDSRYIIQHDPFKTSSGYVLFIEAGVVYPFLLKEDKAVCLEECSAYSSEILVKEFDRNILIYHPDCGGSLYDSEGMGIINSITVSKEQDDGKYYLSGFNRKKTWFAVCEDGKLKQEYVGEQDYDRNIKLHTGYGEYVDYYVKILPINDLGYLIETNWGYVYAPVYGEPSIHVDMFLCKDGKMKKTNAPMSYFTLHNWYNNSFLVYEPSGIVGSPIKYTIYSSNKDVIWEYTKKSEFYVDPFETGDIPPVPISYTEYIWNNNWGGELRIARYNMESSGTSSVWWNVVKTIADNAKTTWTLLDSKSKNWRYRIDVLNYDGSKEQINFVVNIETGKLTYM